MMAIAMMWRLALVVGAAAAFTSPPTILSSRFPTRAYAKSPPPSLSDRFTAPVVTDAALPLSDIFVAGAAVPGFIAVASLLGGVRPSWLVASAGGGGAVAAALRHGGVLGAFFSDRLRQLRGR
jgi:hypothetical protein